MRLSTAVGILAAVSTNVSSDGVLLVQAKRTSTKNLRGQQKVSGGRLKNAAKNRRLKSSKSSKGIAPMGMPDGGGDPVSDSTIVVDDGFSEDEEESASSAMDTVMPSDKPDDVDALDSTVIIDNSVSPIKEKLVSSAKDKAMPMEMPAGGDDLVPDEPKDAAESNLVKEDHAGHYYPVFCTMDVMDCGMGVSVGRDPANDCQFFPCPSFADTTLTTAEPPTYIQSRSRPPTSLPTQEPTTAEPSALPTASPVTDEPTTEETSAAPTASPVTDEPTSSPVVAEADGSTRADEGSSPVAAPSTVEVDEDVVDPTAAPTTNEPTTAKPSDQPSAAPVTNDPTTAEPSAGPTTDAPTIAEPNAGPTVAPTLFPTTPGPTNSPTASPTPVCAGLMVRAQDCGATNKNRPKSCCAGLICANVRQNNEAYMRCVEPSVEDVVEMIVDAMAPSTEAPVGPPTEKPSLAPVPPPTPAPVLMGRTDTCAAFMERAVSCGAENTDRPHSCCPGLVCSDNSQGTTFRCVDPPPAVTLPIIAAPTSAAPTTAPIEAIVLPSDTDGEVDAMPVGTGEVDTMPTEEVPDNTISTEETSDISEKPEPSTPDEESPAASVDDAGCGIEIDTQCFIQEDGAEAVDCRTVSTTTAGPDEMMDVTWSYALRNTCPDKWTVIARQNLQSCDLCLKSGLVCGKEQNFFLSTNDNCAEMDESGRYLGLPPGCSITQNVMEQVQVGSEENGRCMYTKEIKLRVIEGKTAKPVDKKYSFVAPMPWNDQMTAGTP